MKKIDFTQYETKDAFLKAFPIENGSLNLQNKGITDRDLTHILKLLGTEPNLKWLSLSDNQLTTISDKAFNGLTNLKWLYLSDNQLTTISDKAFNGLTNLEWLSLSDNKITTLPSSLNKALPNCEICKDGNVVWVDDVATQETAKQEPIECGNCMDEIKNKITNIELAISKLQEDKEVLKKALQIMINN